MTWANLGKAFAASWERSTNLANWAMTELAKADVARMPGDKKMPPMPKVYLYPKARERFPDMPSKSIAALLHAVEQRYRKSRYAVIWTSEQSLPRYRYPFPFPVNNQGWEAKYGEGKVPLIELRLQDSAVVLRLRGGIHFRRQLAAFAKIVSGDALPGELNLYRKRANSGDHRNGVNQREPGGGSRAPFRVMAQISVWLLRPAISTKHDGVLEVHTSPDHFLVASAPNRKPWIMNADHVKRWSRQHHWRLDRIAQDLKHEVRRPKRATIGMTECRQRISDKHQRRIDTFCHQAAAWLAGHAARQGIAEVRFDSTNRAYLPEFPWFRFQEYLAAKLDEKGIRLDVKDGQDKPSSDQAMAA